MSADNQPPVRLWPYVMAGLLAVCLGWGLRHVSLRPDPGVQRATVAEAATVQAPSEDVATGISSRPPDRGPPAPPQQESPLREDAPTAAAATEPPTPRRGVKTPAPAPAAAATEPPTPRRGVKAPAPAPAAAPAVSPTVPRSPAASRPATPTMPPDELSGVTFGDALAENTPRPQTTPAPPASAAQEALPPDWPTFARRLLPGGHTVRIRNPNPTAVKIGLRSEGAGLDLDVPASGVRSVEVPAGVYAVFLCHENRRNEVFQGDSVTLRLPGQGVEIQLVARAGGNYGMRRYRRP